MEWMLVPFKRYADFEGRSRRMEYWMYQVFTMLVYLALGLLMFAGLPWGEIDRTANAPPGALFWIGGSLMVLWYFFTFVPDIAVTVRRLHDQDLSGWMYLIRLVPYLGPFVIMVFMFIDGQRWNNRFGPDPKGKGDVGIFS